MPLTTAIEQPAYPQRPWFGLRPRADPTHVSPPDPSRWAERPSTCAQLLHAIGHTGLLLGDRDRSGPGRRPGGRPSAPRSSERDWAAAAGGQGSRVIETGRRWRVALLGHHGEVWWRRRQKFCRPVAAHRVQGAAASTQEPSNPCAQGRGRGAAEGRSASLAGFGRTGDAAVRRRSKVV